MKHQAGDFVQAVNPIRGGIEMVMITKTFVQGGVLFYWVTNGPDEWDTVTVRAVTEDRVKPKRRARK